jgi:hypothetical protein
MQDSRKNYLLLAAMVGTSMAVMYGLTYLNSYAIGHVRYSETRLYMTLMMGSAMTVIMLAYMRSMYQSKALNAGILTGSVLVFALSLGLVRSQTTVADASWMRAMIPHHSIAILTSERAELRDVRVRRLADDIVEAQRKEIQEMDWLLEDIRVNGVAETVAEAEARDVPTFYAQGR